jgi:hypothetical protein
MRGPIRTRGGIPSPLERIVTIASLSTVVLLALTVMLIILWGGCGFRSGPPDWVDAALDAPPPDAAADVVRVATPEIAVHPGELASWCYFDRLPSEEVAIVSWRARLGPGVAEASLLSVGGGVPGTLAACPTGIGPIRLFDAISDGDRLDFPRDDASGRPVAQHLDPGQAVMIRIVMRGATSGDLSGSAEFVGVKNRDLQVTRVRSYLALNSMIDVLPGRPDEASTATFGGICDPGAASSGSFFSLSIRTHAHGTSAEIRDDSGEVLLNLAPSAPSSARWPPLVRVTGSIQFRCSYENRDSYRIQYGDDPGTSEVCEVAGLFYPSEGDGQTMCLDSHLLQP